MGLARAEGQHRLTNSFSESEPSPSVSALSKSSFSAASSSSSDSDDVIIMPDTSACARCANEFRYRSKSHLKRAPLKQRASTAPGGCRAHRVLLAVDLAVAVLVIEVEDELDEVLLLAPHGEARQRHQVLAVVDQLRDELVLRLLARVLLQKREAVQLACARRRNKSRREPPSGTCSGGIPSRLCVRPIVFALPDRAKLASATVRKRGDPGWSLTRSWAVREDPTTRLVDLLRVRAVILSGVRRPHQLLGELVIVRLRAVRPA